MTGSPESTTDVMISLKVVISPLFLSALKERQASSDDDQKSLKKFIGFSFRPELVFPFKSVSTKGLHKSTVEHALSVSLLFHKIFTDCTAAVRRSL